MLLEAVAAPHGDGRTLAQRLDPRVRRCESALRPAPTSAIVAGRHLMPRRGMLGHHVQGWGKSFKYAPSGSTLSIANLAARPPWCLETKLRLRRWQLPHRFRLHTLSLPYGGGTNSPQLSLHQLTRLLQFAGAGCAWTTHSVRRKGTRRLCLMTVG